MSKEVMICKTADCYYKYQTAVLQVAVLQDTLRKIHTKNRLLSLCGASSTLWSCKIKGKGVKRKWKRGKQPKNSFQSVIYLRHQRNRSIDVIRVSIYSSRIVFQAFSVLISSRMAILFTYLMDEPRLHMCIVFVYRSKVRNARSVFPEEIKNSPREKFINSA